MAYENEKDDFWDLSRIVPKKRPLPKFATNTPLRDYNVSGEEKDIESDDRRLTFPDKSSKGCRRSPFACRRQRLPH